MDRINALCDACLTGDLPLVTRLLRQRGGKGLINELGSTGFTPLFIACMNGHESTVLLLLDRGAKINLAKDNGATPLYIACQNGHESTVLLLLGRGAKINLAMDDGMTPLYIA